MSTKQNTKVTTHDAEADERNKDIKIYVDGNIVHRDEAKVSVYDSGFMLGDGMWEGMRLYNGKWAFFDEHMDRLFDSCKAVSLDIGMSREEVATALRSAGVPFTALKPIVGDATYDETTADSQRYVEFQIVIDTR